MALPLQLGCESGAEQCSVCRTALLRASVQGHPALPVNLYSALLNHYNFGYCLLIKGASRMSSKLDVLNPRLSKPSHGSTEGEEGRAGWICVSATAA